MLVASKKKVDQRFIPYIDYENETKNNKGEATKVKQSVGFYEIEKKKVLSDNGKLRVLGGTLTEHFVETEDENHIKKVPYSGKTLMISIKNSQYTVVELEATEEHKIKYSAAYEAFLNYKTVEDQRNSDVNKMKDEIEELKKQLEKKSENKAK